MSVTGAAADGNLASLKVYASYDKGEPWIRAAVLSRHALVLSPAPGKGGWLKAVSTDKLGNTVTPEIIDAHRAK
ncbi:hypothetical protein GTY65_40010 [Streptomyces sp. SID8379]|nr:hypothetical protein [Streptomyces sp. SID8379]